MHPCRVCKQMIIPGWKICNNCDKNSLHDIDIEHMRTTAKAKEKTIQTVDFLLAELDVRIAAEIHYKTEMERYRGLYEVIFDRLRTGDKPKRGY